MSKILILGGNPNNLGGAIANSISDCVLYSRSTRPALNLLDPKKINRVFEKERPEVVVHMGATLPSLKNKKLGTIQDWHEISSLLDVKIKGGYMALDAAVRWKAKIFIFMAGAAMSGDSRFCYFTMANGALWSLVKFATRHTPIDAYYLEMGMVLPSNMGNRHLNEMASEDKLEARRISISPENVTDAFVLIIGGKYPRGSRVVINNGDI